MSLLAQAAMLANQVLPNDRNVLLVIIGGTLTIIGALWALIMRGVSLVIARLEKWLGEWMTKMEAKQTAYETRLTTHEADDTRRFEDVNTLIAKNHRELYDKVSENNDRATRTVLALSNEFAEVRTVVEERLPKRIITPPEGTAR